MTDSDFEKITPAELELSARRPAPDPLGHASHSAAPAARGAALGAAEGPRLEALQRRHTRVLWGIFALLLVLAGGVLFILPRYVTPPAPPAVAIDAPAPTRLPGPAVSPYEEAQRMQQREAAQEVLASLLEVQDRLDAREVQVWAADSYAQAVAQAQAGDEAYRTQQFLEARERYAEGLALLQDIEARSADILAGHLADGTHALEQGDAQAALAAFDLAATVEPGNADAEAGLARAAVLEDVLALLDEGETIQRVGDLEAALERFRQASALDPAHPGAAAAVAQAGQAILDRDFAARMSRGYAAIQAGQPQQAEQHFRQALALKPASADARAAIEQAASLITSSAINSHLASAGEHERAERWQAAVEAYEQALAIDANLVDGREGLERARSRLNLDRFLEATLAEPLRLADAAVHQQTRNILASARAVPAPGPRLGAQISQVEEYLRKALEPVDVALRSDGLTQVTVYRVGELGTFSTQVLSLTPGTYTAVGIRPGYRDVRQEFTVAFDAEPPIVTVACEEQVL